MDGKAIVDAIVALILYIIFAMIYFVILAFIVYYATDLVTDGPGGAATCIGAAILAGATIVAGGGLAEAFKKEVL
jgi:hypothetical protein